MSHFITKKLAGVAQAPNLLAVLIWAVGVIGFTAWTIVDFLPQLDEYQNNNVDTQVATNRDESAWPPNLTVCIPNYSDSLTTISDWLLRGSPTNSCMECDALEQHGWNVWDDCSLTMTGVDGKTALAVAFMHRILNKSSTNGLQDILTLNRSNFNWNQPLLDAVWIFLANVVTQDTGFLIRGPISAIGLAEVAEETFHGDLLDELLVRSFAAIEIYFQRQAIFTYDDKLRSAYSRMPLGNPDLVNNLEICFQASNSALVENFRYAAFVDENDPPWIRSPRSTPFFIWMNDHITLGAPSIVEAVYVTDGSDLKSTYEVVNLDFKVDLKVVETRPDSVCIRNESMPHCAARHFLEATLEKCSCLPFGFKKKFPDMHGRLPYCSPSAYANCSSTLTGSVLSFIDTCSKQCEFISRRSNHIVFAAEDKSMRDLIFGIHFDHLTDSPYVEFSIVTKTSWQKFVSNIGGTVGLYLGFSGLSVVALLVFCMEHVGKWLGDRGHKVHADRNRNQMSQEDVTPVVSKRILLADIVKMIQEQREETMDLIKASEERMIRLLEEKFTMIRSNENH